MRFGIMFKLLAGLCVGTIVTELLLAGVLLSKGQLTAIDPYVVVGILYGIDQETLAEYQNRIDPPKEYSLVDLDELSQRNMAQILNIDMRERSLHTAINDLRYYRSVLSTERDRYDRLRTEFENQLDRLEGAATNANLIRLRDTIANLDPAQAKEQIMTMLQRAEDNGDQEIANDVVVMIKTMPIDKRKKIFSEFRTELEKKRLGYIVHEIRIGNPEVPLIRKVRDRLRQFDSQDKMDTTSWNPQRETRLRLSSRQSIVSGSRANPDVRPIALMTS